MKVHFFNKMSKIKTRKEIKKIAEKLRQEGKTLVTTNGSFDLLHIGHIKFLQEAKQQGDILIVGLNSDASIKKYKSKDRPIINQESRVGMLSSLEFVDYIVLMDEAEIAVPLVKLVKPDVHVNGADYGKDCVEAGAVKEVGARLHIVQLVDGFSTTSLINKIKNIK